MNYTDWNILLITLFQNCKQPGSFLLELNEHLKN